jgi:hypothetical protein
MNKLNSKTKKVQKSLNKLTVNNLMGFLNQIADSKSKQTQKMIQFVDFDELYSFLDESNPEALTKGPFKYPNGATYQGNYKKGDRHGYGV